MASNSQLDRKGTVSDGRNVGLGTAWVARGEGSIWFALINAFHNNAGCVGRKIADQWTRTNLLLTGAPLTDYDRQRWESGNVE